MYVGCWEDKNVNTMFDEDDDNSRDFEIYIADSSQEWKGGMTLNRCVPACVTLGYRYAALQVKSFKRNLIYKQTLGEGCQMVLLFCGPIGRWVGWYYNFKNLYLKLFSRWDNLFLVIAGRYCGPHICSNG